MYARGRLDIDWGDLGAALLYGCLPPADIRDEVAKEWDPNGVSFFTVRTGFDLLLRCLALPEGAEVVCTAVNIPDMFDLIRHHGLVPISVDLDPRTLAPDEGVLADAITPKTRLILITHLLGTRVGMDAVHRVAGRAGIPVIEDCAQALNGVYRGHPASLAAMFSFGPIKTSTALGGALFRIPDVELRTSLCALESEYPSQTRLAWFSVVGNYVLMHALSMRWLYGFFVWACAVVGGSHDQVINGRVLGLKGDDWWKALRRSASSPLLRMLRRRLRQNAQQSVLARREAGLSLLAMLPDDAPVLGRDADEHSFWQFVVTPTDPDACVARLRAAGFDATAGASRLTVDSLGQGSQLSIADVMCRAVYVPAYASMNTAARCRLGSQLSQAFASQP